jgi:hypothetical protein
MSHVAGGIKTHLSHCGRHVWIGARFWELRNDRARRRLERRVSIPTEHDYDWPTSAELRLADEWDDLRDEAELDRRHGVPREYCEAMTVTLGEKL